MYLQNYYINGIYIPSHSTKTVHPPHWWYTLFSICTTCPFFPELLLVGSSQDVSETRTLGDYSAMLIQSIWDGSWTVRWHVNSMPCHLTDTQCQLADRELAKWPTLRQRSQFVKLFTKNQRNRVWAMDFTALWKLCCITVVHDTSHLTNLCIAGGGFIVATTWTFMSAVRTFFFTTNYISSSATCRLLLTY